MKEFTCDSCYYLHYIDREYKCLRYDNQPIVVGTVLKDGSKTTTVDGVVLDFCGFKITDTLRDNEIRHRWE